MSDKKKILVIGGVAAGASFAARARRLNEKADITIVEKGPDVSFANCGLPYHIGGEIPDRGALAVQTPESLQAMLNLNVLTHTEALSIDIASRKVAIKNLENGKDGVLDYDILMLAPGAKPICPPLPGIDSPRILVLRNLQDMDRIKKAAAGARRACVIGAGFIGLEMAEQLQALGLDVTLAELQNQVLPQMDPEMVMLVESELLKNHISLASGDGIAGFKSGDSSVQCEFSSGKKVEADLVILSIGVSPDTQLAQDAGIATGPKGHILVDSFQRTSIPGIYAGGDAVEGKDRIFGDNCSVPLGGPANRQGRVAADHVFLGDQARPYPGSIGTAIVRVFEVAAGLTGWTEKRLKAAGIPFRKTLINENHHAGYFPGAKPLAVKILWDGESGRLYGAQVTGFEGVDKRIDIFATAIAGNMTVEDLCHLELAYAPPFGNAKDPANIAGFTATNEQDGLVETVYSLPDDKDTQILDVRPEPLVEQFPLSGCASKNIPLPMLRSRLSELDRNKPIVTICAMGKSSYFAARILQQNGFKAFSYAGGIKGSLDPRSPAKIPLA